MEDIKEIIDFLDTTIPLVHKPFENSSSKIKFNIGGKNFDLKRSYLVNNDSSFLSSNCSLLPCFCNSKWEYYLLKDQKNRIYFDYDLEWFEKYLKSIILMNDTTELLKIDSKTDYLMFCLVDKLEKRQSSLFEVVKSNDIPAISQAITTGTTDDQQMSEIDSFLIFSEGVKYFDVFINSNR
jgi:hypothetical protein